MNYSKNGMLIQHPEIEISEDKNQPKNKSTTTTTLQEKQNLWSAFIIFIGPRKSRRKLRNFCRPEPFTGL
jgi:hypothetical protein